jgi:hypothetical protein
MGETGSDFPYVDNIGETGSDFPKRAELGELGDPNTSSSNNPGRNCVLIRREGGLYSVGTEVIDRGRG